MQLNGIDCGVYMLNNIESYLKNSEISFSSLTLSVSIYREIIRKRLAEEPQLMTQFRQDINKQTMFRREIDKGLLKTQWKDFKNGMAILATRRCPWLDDGKTLSNSTLNFNLIFLLDTMKRILKGVDFRFYKSTSEGLRYLEVQISQTSLQGRLKEHLEMVKGQHLKGKMNMILKMGYYTKIAVIMAKVLETPGWVATFGLDGPRPTIKDHIKRVIVPIFIHHFVLEDIKQLQTHETQVLETLLQFYDKESIPTPSAWERELLGLLQREKRRKQALVYDRNVAEQKEKDRRSRLVDKKPYTIAKLFSITPHNNDPFFENKLNEMANKLLLKHPHRMIRRNAELRDFQICILNSDGKLEVRTKLNVSTALIQSLYEDMRVEFYVCDPHDYARILPKAEAVHNFLETQSLVFRCRGAVSKRSFDGQKIKRLKNRPEADISDDGVI